MIIVMRIKLKIEEMNEMKNKKEKIVFKVIDY